MSGFDNGTIQSGLFAQTKQLGAILRGSGPPVPAVGVMGDLYIDVQTFFIYSRGEQVSADPWGDFLFTVPAAYRAGLKWFSTYQPANDVGRDGDYCLLWGGVNSYGMQPSIYGPKANGAWPESGDGPDTLLDPAYDGFTYPLGLSDEGNATAFSTSSQLIAAGLSDEYILAVPVAQIANSPVTELGIQTPPAAVVVNINPSYNTSYKHLV